MSAPGGKAYFLEPLASQYYIVLCKCLDHDVNVSTVCRDDRRLPGICAGTDPSLW